jgi:hypothetical protein
MTTEQLVYPNTPVTYRLACPRCEGDEIRVEVMGVAIHRVGIDPVSGTVKRGTTQSDFRKTDVGIDIYVCQDCGYESVTNYQFSQEVPND